jgi:hypothetical protein
MTDAWNNWHCDKVKWVDTSEDPLTHQLAGAALLNRHRRLLKRHLRIVREALDAGVPSEDLRAVLKGDAEELKR